jgi:hypothetical protein
MVEQVHRAADGGSRVEQVDVDAQVGQVHGGGHAGDAGTGHKNRVVMISRS